ncbi:DUF1488 domain-containing protein [Cupriavidus sp. IDO]|uniref:DUF1488 domain-containing protein n=1 Tax=Cupriavidus sp. IDO TaxID=1539142 RepID=UPI000578FC57|nr:DUF1488 domain-containing protein [Cupriavidus sp. IDO]KWR90545.1 hypothetical protein RM96_08900 [Cupriavidus sp. IDO]
MALTFPNPSRSYDTVKHCVWFWGYDNASEITFLVEEHVLKHFESAIGPDEADVLAVFDRHRDQILEIARARYGEGQQKIYALH